MKNPSVSVVIPCGSRARDLARAAGSVARQDYPGPIELILVSSHCRNGVQEELDGLVAQYPLLCRVHDVSAGIDTSANRLLTIFGACQIAFKRNQGVAVSEGDLIGHLDDDNIWEPDHLSRLVRTLQKQGGPAVHSWRRLFMPDGTPFVAPLYPWIKRPDPECARYIFAELVRLGIRRHGSNEVRDSFGYRLAVETNTVDSSEWLLTKELASKVPYRESVDFRTVSHWISDDLLFCRDLMAAGISQVGSSECFTLSYYLGGRSTSWLLHSNHA